MSHDNTHDVAATGGDVSRPDALTVAEAAQLLGISPRSIQRRCREGKFPARRVESEFGEQWEIERAPVEKAATDRARRARQEQRQANDTPTTEGTTEPRHVAPQTGNVAGDFAARYVEQIETENRFLRAAVEQHQRAEAELRAALRKALEAQPRELTAGMAQDAPKSGAATDTATIAQNPTERPANPSRAALKAEPRPLWKVILGIR